MKQILKVSMFGKVLAIYQQQDAAYEFKVCQICGRKKYWIDEFGSFLEAVREVEMQLYS